MSDWGLKYDPRVVAHHEAAHAVVRYVVGKRSRVAYGHVRTSLDPPGIFGLPNRVRFDRPSTTFARNSRDRTVMTFLAGPYAARKTGLLDPNDPNPNADGGRKDRWEAEGIADLFHRIDPAEPARYLDKMTRQMEAVLAEPPAWEAIKDLAAALVEIGTVPWKSFKGIVEPHLNALTGTER